MGCKKYYSGSGAVLSGIAFILGLVAYILFFTRYADHVTPQTYPNKVTIFVWNHKLLVMLLAASILTLINCGCWLPFALLDNGACCLGTVKEAALKAAVEAKGKTLKGALIVLSLLTFAFMGGYTIYEFVKMGALLKAVLVPCVLTAFSSFSLLINVIASILYYMA